MQADVTNPGPFRAYATFLRGQGHNSSDPGHVSSNDAGTSNDADKEDAVLSPPQSEDSSSRTPVLRRRNGKLQSCEPCRKSKVSCDHGRPKCGRCIKKGINSECVYHPAPLTRPADSRGAVTKRRPSPVSISNASEPAAAGSLQMLSRLQSPSAFDTPQSEQGGEYLGPTNYAAIFRENQPQIGAELWRNAETGSDSYTKTLSSATSRFGCGANTIAVGTEILAQFPSERLSEDLFKEFFNSCFAPLPIQPIQFGLRQFWLKWGSQMQAKQFQTVAQALLKNRPKPLRSVKHTDEWLKPFTADHLSFEMIGVFFAIFGLGTMSKPPWDPMFDIQKHGRLGKKMFMEKHGETADACLDLCSGESIVSEPLIWLMHYAQICQSQYRGDDDAFQWQKLGLVSTACTAFGLHREITMTGVPFMVAESRRRTFASVYVADKQVSTYTGRPPRLSKRFCVCKLPLDLSDSEMLLEGPELEQALSRLDKSGWNTDGGWRPVCILRLLLIMAKLRDEILELCLGPSAEITLARKQDLKRRTTESYYAVPCRFVLVDEDANIMLTDGDLLTTQFVFRIEYLFNIFLIERLPSTEAGDESQGNLIQTSLDILQCLTFIQKYRDKLESPWICMAWELVYYAIPGASVLCLELLKQHQYPQRYKHNLPRSDIIQALSIYLLCLNTVGPEAGNYHICLRMQKVVKRILGEVLETQPEPESEQSGSNEASQLTPDVNFSAMIEANDDPDFMNWLQSVDWTGVPWMDSLGGV